MGNLKNAALFWCNIKKYWYLFLIVVSAIFFVSGLLKMSNSTKEQEKSNARAQVIFSAFIGIISLVWYFFVQTNVGCGISIAGNVAGLLRR
jgi:predicted small integral membrane protein